MVRSPFLPRIGEEDVAEARARSRRGSHSRRGAQTACSRDEPQPKLSLARPRCAASRYGGLVQDEVGDWREPSVAKRKSRNRIVAEVVGARLLQIARRQDLVGVDIGPRRSAGPTARSCGERLPSLRPPVPDRARTSVSRPVTAAAAAMAGAHQVGARTRPLAADEVAVRWSRRERWPGASVSPLVPRHIGAAGLAPLETGLEEHPVEPLRLRLHASRRLRAGHHPGLARPAPHGGRWTTAAALSQVLDAAVGARADEARGRRGSRTSGRPG